MASGPRTFNPRWFGTAWLAASLVACGARTETVEQLGADRRDPTPTTDPASFDDLWSSTLTVARLACDRALQCFGEPEAGGYDCFIPISSGTYFWSYPELGPNSRSCWRELFAEDAERVSARWDCLYDRLVPFAACLEPCPDPADDCFARISEASCDSDIELQSQFRACLDSLE